MCLCDRTVTDTYTHVNLVVSHPIELRIEKIVTQKYNITKKKQRKMYYKFIYLYANWLSIFVSFSPSLTHSLSAQCVYV